MNKPATDNHSPDIEAVLKRARQSGGLMGFLTPRNLLWAGIVVFAAVGAYALVFSGGPTAKINYVTEPSIRSDLTAIVTATGTVQPTNQVDVSSELSGTVRNVAVDFNSEVKVGAVLAELDTDKLRAAVAASRAKLSSAKAKVGIAKATLIEMTLVHDRKVALATKNVGSDQDVDTAKAATDRAAASVTSAEADVAVAEADLVPDETNLAKARILSPINGIILKRNVDPGQTVASSLQAPILFTIAEDLKKMEVQVDVDEADVGAVAPGQMATFSVDAYADRKFPAQIRELRFGSEVVQGVVTYKAVLTTDNSELLLRPGMTATAEITVRQVKDALSVPNAALRFLPPARETSEKDRGLLKKILPGRPHFRAASQKDEGGPNRRVWTLQSGEPVAVPVVVGLSDGKRTEIIKGDLAPGQAVIVDRGTVKK